MIIPLQTPFVYEEHTISQIDLDLAGKLNPRTQEYLEARYKREILRTNKTLDSEERGVYTVQPFMDKRFRLLVFEWVTGIPQEAIRNEKFPIETYNVVLDAIFYFFVNWREPSTEAPPEMEEMGNPTPLGNQEIEASPEGFGASLSL